MKPYYADDLVTLYHGDCREIDAWLAADVLVTDPPYGMALRSSRSGEHGDLRISGDETPALRDQALAMWGTKPALVFGRWSVPRPAGTRALLTWDKGEHTGMGDLKLPWKPNTEEIYVLGGGLHGATWIVGYQIVRPCPGQESGPLAPHREAGWPTRRSDHEVSAWRSGGSIRGLRFDPGGGEDARA